jgi:hypothetical protein
MGFYPTRRWEDKKVSEKHMKKECSHLFQQVSPLNDGIMVQNCCKCRALIAKWHIKSGKMVQEVGNGKNTDFEG